MNLPSDPSPQQGQPQQGDTDAAPPEQGTRVERRTLDAVFGEVLPDTTADERDDRRGSTSSDDWYAENRPPHHDR